MRQARVPLLAVNEDNNQEAGTDAVVPQVEAGNVHLPAERIQLRLAMRNRAPRR